MHYKYLAMNSINHSFYKTLLLDSVEKNVADARQKLINELITAGNDPVVWKRRVRMLSQLSQWHSDIVEKIYTFETDSVEDYQLINSLWQELYIVTSRNA
jgi:hypothetical protein